jgi:hypothetical protein
VILLNLILATLRTIQELTLIPVSAAKTQWAKQPKKKH